MAAKGLAIASLVLGILSVLTLGAGFILLILAIVFGAIALVKNGKSPEKGVLGMSIAGIVLGALLIIPGIMSTTALVSIGYFSVANTHAFTQDKCLADSPTGITCNTKAAVDASSNSLTMLVTNGAGVNVNITNVTATGSSCSVTSWDLLNYTTGKSIKYQALKSGQYAQLYVHCSSIKGKLFKDTFKVNFMDLDNRLAQHSTIEVIAST